MTRTKTPGKKDLPKLRKEEPTFEVTVKNKTQKLQLYQPTTTTTTQIQSQFNKIQCKNSNKNSNFINQIQETNKKTHIHTLKTQTKIQQKKTHRPVQ